MEHERHVDLRAREVRPVRAQRERRGRRPLNGEREPVRVGQADRHRVRAGLRRHPQVDAHALCLVRRERREGLRLCRVGHELALRIAELPDEPHRSHPGRGPGPRAGVRDRDGDALLRSGVHGDGGLRHLVARVRRRLEDRAVHECADRRDEVVRVLVERVPGRRDHHARTGFGEDDPRVVGEARKVAGLVRDQDVRRQLCRESVVDLLPFEPREHPIGRGCRDELALREEREERSERARRRPVVLAVVVRDVEVGHPRLRQGDVDVRAAEDVPERERGAVVGDRDHRLERLVERERGAGLLERSIARHVLRRDEDRVVVVELAAIDPALRLREDPELVERRRDHLLVRRVGEERGRRARVAHPNPGPPGEARDETVQLAHEVLRARLRPRARERGDDERDHEGKSCRAHHREVTREGAGCFSA